MEIHEFKLDFRAMFARVSSTSCHFICKACLWIFAELSNDSVVNDG